MASLPPLLPTPPASINPRDTDAVESPSPKRHRPLEPDASGSRRREPNSPPSSSPRVGRSPPSKFRRRSRSPPSPQSKVPLRSRSPPRSKVRRRSRSLSPSRVRRRSRSPPPSRVRRRSRSPPPSRARQQSRSPSRVRRRSKSPSRVRRRSRSPSPSRVRRRSRSPSRVRHRSRSPLPSRVRRRSRSPSPSRVRRRSRSPSPSRVRRRSRSPPPSRVWHRSRSPPYISRLAELQHPKRPSAEAAVEGESASPSSSDDSSMENWPSHSHNNCEHPETSSAAMEKRPNPAIRWDGQKLYGEKMDGKNQSDDKVPSRNARRKKMKRQRRAGAKNEMGEAPSRRKKMKRGIWSEAKKEFREMKKDKLFENIKKLQTCVWLLEKDGADMAEIMEFRSMLETTKKQYAENEAQLAKEGSSAPLQVLKRDRLEKMHGMAAPAEKAERDEPNMDSGKVEGSDAVSERNELAEEVNHLKSELETVRENRDYQLAQAQSLMADVAKQKEVARRYGVELEDAMRRVASLEEGCLLRRETIKALQIQLASANEKLTDGPRLENGPWTEEPASGLGALLGYLAPRVSSPSPSFLPRAATAMSRLPSNSRRRSRSPPPSKFRRRSRSPPPSKARRRSRSPPPSKVWRRSRSPSSYVSVTQRREEPQRAKRPSAEAAVEGERAGPSSLHESLAENRPSHSRSNYKHPETSSAAVEKRPDPAIQGNEQEFHSEKMDGKNLRDHKAPSRNARRKKIRREVWKESKRQIREMKKDKLLEKIKKLQDYVSFLEKEGEDTAEIMKVRSLLKSTQKQYEENEELLAQTGPSASQQVLNSDRLEKTHVETMAAPVDKPEGDEQNMDSGEAEGRSLDGCKAVSEQNELAEEANRLKSEIETVRQDHDYQLSQVQSLIADVAKQKEVARFYGVELEDAMRRVAALEEESLLQDETIRMLQVQLASTNQKLAVPSPLGD